MPTTELVMQRIKKHVRVRVNLACCKSDPPQWSEEMYAERLDYTHVRVTADAVFCGCVLHVGDYQLVDNP